MRQRYEEELRTLHAEMLEMGRLCEEAITCAINALFEYQKSESEQDSDRAWVIMKDFESITSRVFETDRKIDAKEKDIESLCFRLLLRQQPVAGDLRKISASLKMISDLERIGDQSSDIAEIVGYIRNSPLRYKVSLREMAKAAAGMVKVSINAYIRNDAQMAEDVIRSDDIVDNYFKQVKSDLINEISANRATAEDSIDVLMIAKYFERIADHATNIAEWVIFSVTGVHINDELL